jgi:hypothetical protein
MHSEIETINEILSSWDPIGVGEPECRDEYERYAPVILNVVCRGESLKNCLDNILVYEIGLSSYAAGNRGKAEVSRVCEKIMRVFSN